MSLIKKLIGGLSVLCLFGCSSPNEEKERLELIKWLDHHLTLLSTQVSDDIEREKKGLYPHEAKKTEYNSKGQIDYELKDKHGKRLTVSEYSLLKTEDIKNTAGFRLLEDTVIKLGYQLQLKRMTVDGDGVDSYGELDEYIDEKEDYFVITISGWAMH